ncbi:MAG: type II toxin-antitoxin system RelE/ParE family toxin [Nitrospirales bacterium]
MAYTVHIAPAAERQLKILPKPTQSQISKRLLKLEVNPRPSGVKKLEGEKDLYRLRVGDFRVIYTIRDRELIVLIVKIGHRREIYRQS